MNSYFAIHAAFLFLSVAARDGSLSETTRENIRKLQRTPGGNTETAIEEFTASGAVGGSENTCIQPNCYYPQVFDPASCSCVDPSIDCSTP